MHAMANGLSPGRNHRLHSPEGPELYDLGLFFHVTSTHLMPTFQCYIPAILKM